jgi:Putative Ig domain/Galactose oxidase, central domain
VKKTLLILISVWIFCALNGCGGAGSTTPPPPAIATHFSVTSNTSTPMGGTAFNVTVTALSASGQTATGYSGTVHITSTDSQAILPAASTLSNGVGTFSVTLKTAGNQTITAADTASLTGTSSAITVGVSASTHFSVVAASYAASAGMPISIVVTAIDASGSTVSTYSGSVHFTSSDAKAVLPANSPLTGGVGNFSVTLNTSGGETIMAADTVSSSINGTSNTFNVSGSATHFSVANVASSAATRSPVTLFVVALDASNNESAGYAGTVRITSSDKNAILPASGPLHNGDGNFQITLETAGSQTITATDTVRPSLTGTSSSIAVTATPALTITSAAPPNGTVGSSYGPTNTVYEKCIFSFPLHQTICNPCVPNTAACGGSYPSCSHVPLMVICVTSQTYDGFQLTGAGGVPPYTWSAASLPPGLNLKFTSPENLISGTPTPGSAGTYNAMVTLSDSGMPPAPKTLIYPIVTNNPPPPVVSVAPAFPGATVNQPFSYTFTATAGLPPYQNWTEKGALPPGIAPLTSGAVLSGTPTMTGLFLITVTVDDSLGQMSAAQVFNLQVYQHGFKATGNMGTMRNSHTAVLLQDGTVLVVGGQGLASAEKFDPGTGKFTATPGSMTVARSTHTATLLNTGKVLIAGGTNGTTTLSTAELFDPVSGTFSLTAGGMSVARAGHTATLLADGRVLITGGGSITADLFDPNTGMFTPTKGAMATARNNDTATLLANGKVLITGGFAGSTEVATAELYDPMAETFSAAGSMTVARGNHTATLLNTGTDNGKVLLAGGNNIPSAELYDPTTGGFSSTGSMATARAYHTAILLGDGTVLMVGGFDAGNNTLAAAELFDPASGTFTGTGSLQTPRAYHTSTLLKVGTVLVTGGVDAGTVLATSELYQ